MTLPYEALLAFGVLGFYLFDSAILLYSDELVFIESNGKWTFDQGSSWQVMLKNPYLPHPLTPGRSIFRICWSGIGNVEQDEDPEMLRRFLAALAPLRIMVFILLVLLLIILPVFIVYFGVGSNVLILCGLAYLIICTALVYIYRKRSVLELSQREFVSLAFHSLACAPFAINMVRALCQERRLSGAPINFAMAVFDEVAFSKLVGVICARLEEEMGLHDEGSVERARLGARRKAIMGMTQCR